MDRKKVFGLLGRIFVLVGACFLLTCVWVGKAEAKLNVVTALTDHAWLVKEIGGEKVRVKALLTGREDPHHASAKPSLILMMSRASLFVDPGMELTVGYVPLILRNSRNPKVQVGSKGYVDASIYVTKMDVPQSLTRTEGDVHPEGNPHYTLDPINMIYSGRAVLEGLIRVDATNAKYYQRRFLALEKKIVTKLVGPVLVQAVGTKRLMAFLKAKRLIPFLRRTKVKGKPILRYLGGWLRQMLPFEGKAFVTHHKLWPYFFHRFSIHFFGALEPKPGIPPSARHLLTTIRSIKRSRPNSILVASYHSTSSARFVSKKTGLKFKVVPILVNALPNTKTYPQVIDQIVKALTTP